METKARLDRTNIVGWLKTIAGFANAEGGTLFIGVEDKTSKLIGFDKKDADSERGFLYQQVNEHLLPRPSIKLTFLPYMANKRTLFIIKAEIEQSPARPITLTYKGIPGIYMRRDGFTNGATLEEITTMVTSNQNLQYDTLDSDMPYQRKDFTKLIQFSREHEGKPLSDKAFASMGFFSEHGKLKNGAVLFRDQYKGEKAALQCALYTGLSKGSDRILSVNKFQGNLIDSIQFAMDFIQQRMNRTIIKKNFGRENLDAYPRRALFEGVINAIAHRDYFLDGTQIQVDMFKDRLEISSPGSFYKGARIERTHDLSRYTSKRRNELISDILVACNVMEAAGTGFDKIIQAYEKVDDRHKPVIYSTSDHFTLILPDLTYAEGIASLDELPQIDFMALEKNSEYDEKILTYCHYGARKVAEIASFIGVKNSSYLRSHIIGFLVERGYLREVSDKIPRRYRTNPDFIL